jgi:hypothetical protein
VTPFIGKARKSSDAAKLVMANIVVVSNLQDMSASQAGLDGAAYSTGFALKRQGMRCFVEVPRDEACSSCSHTISFLAEAIF